MKRLEITFPLRMTIPFFSVMKISKKPEVMNEKELLTLNPTVVVNAINVRLWESKMTHVSP